MSLINEEQEDAGMKLLQLEEKTNKLENALTEISKETRAVLGDVRTVLTDLENPMNYLKGLGIDEVMLTMAENITEKKLKEFMEKRLESLVRTVVEGQLKEMVDGHIAKFVEEQVGSIIEGKIREMKEKGILKVPIDVDELKRALDSKLAEVMGSDAVKGNFNETIQQSIKSEIEKLTKQNGALQESMRNEFEGMLKKETSRIRDELLDPVNQIQNSAPSVIKKEEERKLAKQPTAGVSLVGLTACAGSLMHIFGRRGAERAVDDYYRMGWFSDETKSSLLRIMSIINTKRMPDDNEVSINDHVIATYLFEKLGNGGNDIDFIAILNLLNTSASLTEELPV
jgi:archaellum component FlaD/FlaE